jgi:hypothetical protein
MKAQVARSITDRSRLPKGRRRRERSSYRAFYCTTRTAISLKRTERPTSGPHHSCLYSPHLSIRNTKVHIAMALDHSPVANSKELSRVSTMAYSQKYASIYVNVSKHVFHWSHCSGLKPTVSVHHSARLFHFVHNLARKVFNPCSCFY